MTVAEMDRRGPNNSAAEERRNLQQVIEGATGHSTEDTQQIADIREETRLLRSLVVAVLAQQTIPDENQLHQTPLQS